MDSGKWGKDMNKISAYGKKKLTEFRAKPAFTPSGNTKAKAQLSNRTAPGAMIDSYRGFGGDKKKMPMYKKGGMVKKTGPAVVHKGELVIPKKKVNKVKKLLKKK